MAKRGSDEWQRRPLFAAPPRRRYGRWLFLLLILLGAVLFFFPGLVTALLAPLRYH